MNINDQIVQEARAYWIRNIESVRINWGTPLDTENAKNKLQILLDAMAPTPAQEGGYANERGISTTMRDCIAQEGGKE